MSTTSDEQQLKPCLTKIIGLVEQCIEKFRPTEEQTLSQSNDNLLENSQLNNNIYTFTLDDEENELLRTLTSQIETILNEHCQHLSHICLNYLFDFLHTYQYDRKQQRFLSSFNIGDLHGFLLELQGLLASVEAFPASFNGDLQIVQKFIKKYPTYKDKPGLWETTLLFSAARNKHFDIVKYLIEDAHCSVNAQNSRDVDFALNTSSTNYNPRPTAGSTALHAACFYNHLNIVQYLVQHDANYFIRNQAYETPINNGERYLEIKNFFHDYLIMNYSIAPPDNLPDTTIMDDNQRPKRDSMWEYKPFQDPKWYKFSAQEASLLQNSLVPTNEFKQQVYLKVAKGLYSVSIIEFLRSGKLEQDPQKNMAWIRCRGSSILNFDCYCIWQVMLIQHDKISKDEDNTPSLKVQHFPVMFNSHFKLQLNNWYTCDDKTSSLLDNSMNYRRKIISIDVPNVGKKLVFNLQTFEFSNDEKTILGYIRWIPKLISSTDSKDKKLVYVDNYQPMATVQPIPLTTKLRAEILHIKSADQQQVNDTEDQDDEDTSGLQFGIENDDEAGDDDFENSSGNNKNVS